MGISQVAQSIASRWNFPEIEYGHDFTRSSLVKDNATIYNLAHDARIYRGAGRTPDWIYQEARELGVWVLSQSSGGSPNGPIYFYAKIAVSGLAYEICNDGDDPEVNLLENTVTKGNKYFSPASDPNQWTTSTIRTAYEADPDDCFEW